MGKLITAIPDGLCPPCRRRLRPFALLSARSLVQRSRTDWHHRASPEPVCGPHPTFASAAICNDLYRYDPATAAWTALSPAGIGPVARQDLAFEAMPDGALYLFGGWGAGGGEPP